MDFIVGQANAAAGIAVAVAVGIALFLLGRWSAPGRGARQPVRSAGGPVAQVLDPFDQLDMFGHVVESAGIGVYHWDMRTGRIVWSHLHREIFGISAERRLDYEVFRERIHPDDLARVELAIDAAIRARHDYLLEFRLLLPGGAIRHVRGSGRVSFDDAGEALRMSGAIIDISEATEARLQAARRERELAIIVAHLPDVIARFDTSRRFLFISPGIERITGISPAAFIGKTIEELGIDSFVCSRWRALLDNVRRNGVERDTDFTYTGPDGQERFFVVRAFPELGSGGEVRSMLTISSDHTFRERAMIQLREGQALLEQADQRKNEYIAMLAHELRSPLAPISTSVELMKRSDQPGVWRASMTVIERQLGQLVELVDDLMDIARVSSGKLHLRLSQVALQSAVQRAVETAMPLVDRAGQQLAVDLPAATVWLEADPVRLTQIFANLLTNASKYSPAGAHITIAARADGDSASITVTDDGVGLTPDAMENVFELFSQVDARQELAQGGLGIGLSLVRQLVALHGGEVSVASEGIGKGSCFTVRLPVDGRAPAERDEPAAAQDKPKALKVLVVDDNVDGASSLAQLLQMLGHVAHSAHTGRDALEAAATGGFDLVLLDLGLPDMSGVQVALHIRGKAWGRNLRIVALTGLGQQQDRDLTMAAGFNLHLVKPIRIDQLIELVGDAG